MMTENLVDRLNVCRESSISKLCENCIYSKHTAYPYNDNKSREKEILECIYIDIWGPCQVQSTGGVLMYILTSCQVLFSLKIIIYHFISVNDDGIV